MYSYMYSYIYIALFPIPRRARYNGKRRALFSRKRMPIRRSLLITYYSL